MHIVSETGDNACPDLNVVTCCKRMQHDCVANMLADRDLLCHREWRSADAAASDIISKAMGAKEEATDEPLDRL